MNVKVLPVALVVLLGGAPLGGSALAGTVPSYTIEDVTACSADAMRLCRNKMPDLAAIQDCMRDHYDQLRPKCKARFDKNR